MLRIELKEHRPGYGNLNIKGWTGSTKNIEICVQRNQDNQYFSDGSIWSAEPVWHVLSDTQFESDTLSATVGPWLIDGLLQTSSARYLLFVRDGSEEEKGPIRMVGNLLASSAGGNSARAEDIRNESTPTIEVPDDSEDIVETADSPPDNDSTLEENTPEPTEKKPILLWSILGLVLLGAILGALYYFLFSTPKTVEPAVQTPQSATTATPTAVTTAPTPAVGPCQLVENSSGDELTFIQTCLQSSPDTQQILTVIAQAKKAKKCSIAQRLYANQAQGGNADIAVAYAKEYETGSDCFPVDKATAIYWYETASSNDPNNATAKQKLEELNNNASN